MKTKLWTLLGAVALATSVQADSGVKGGVPALEQRLGVAETELREVQMNLGELVKRVAALEAATPSECPCFDAALLSQYRHWVALLEVIGEGEDEAGNRLLNVMRDLAAQMPGVRAGITSTETISPTGQVLSASYTCTFEDTAPPDQADDPNFPFLVMEQNLTQGEYRACNGAMESLVRRRGLIGPGGP